ncbi:MAG: hypothetical protein HQ572_02445 [Candidatus Omnitrophica bacterium]|nr:hypothetical protein [Candidatus Omnitrophota bacterium]
MYNRASSYIDSFHANINSFVPVLICFILITPIYLGVGYGISGINILYIYSIFQILIIALTQRFVFDTPETLPKLFVFIITLQNIFIGLAIHLSPGMPINSIRLLISFTSVYVLVACIAILFFDAAARRSFFNVSQMLPFEKIAILFIICAGAYFFKGKAPLFAKFGYLRNFTLFFFIYILGKLSVKGKGSLKDFFRFLFIFSFVICVFGFIERFILPESFWLDTLNVLKVTEAKGRGIEEGLLPSVFMTDFFGVWTRRLASTFAEPVNAAYFFAFTTIAALVARNIFMMVVAGATLFLTLGKGGMLVASVTLVVMIAAYTLFRKRMDIKRAVILLPLFVTFINFYVGKFRGSAAAHMQGLSSLPINLFNYPLGRGLGTGGNWGSIFEVSIIEKRITMTGAESMVGTIGHQMGIIGMLLYILFFIFMVRYLLKSYRLFLNRGDKYLAKNNLFAAAIMLGIFMVSLFQENTFGPQAGGIYFLFIGMVVGTNKLAEND